MTRQIFVLAMAAVPLLSGQANPNPPSGSFPIEQDINGFHIAIYPPQVDSWKNNKVEARCAVTATPSGATQEIFGIVTVTARTDVDKETRMVALEDMKISSASFPGASNDQGEIEKAVRDSLKVGTVGLDRLLADLQINGAETEAVAAAPLKTDPPKIIFSQVPAVLILIDGNPSMQPVQGFAKYSRVINTPALILFDTSASRYYLDGNSLWMTATNLDGPWTQAAMPPPELNQIRTQIMQDEAKDPHDHSKDAGSPAPTAAPSAVFVSTTPAELIQTTGAPQYSPIAKTQLAYVTNTSGDVFRDVKTQDYYVLLAGRWYQSKTLDGPWMYISGSMLPKDFKNIPPANPKYTVLVSIPGTEQAKEAVIANQIPQTAEVKRAQAKLTVAYDGAPQFRPIEGTSMEYAINTSFEVVHAAGRYYSVSNGVWFVSDSPAGPWAVADSIPPEIYSIPPSSPLYHDRFVYVYGATPDTVYVGYTPGYLGAFIWDDTVVFGTGWWYPGWIGADWYGWPWTWGFGFQFGYFGGGWIWRPAGYWWYHNPGFMGRVYYNHWNPHWSPLDNEKIHNNVNVYNRWDGNVVSPRVVRAPVASAAANRTAAAQRDMYAGRDGKVYERQGNNWTQHTNNQPARRVQPAPELQRQQQSRSFGQSRMSEFGGSGISRGFPRSMPGGGGGGGRRR